VLITFNTAGQRIGDSRYVSIFANLEIVRTAVQNPIKAMKSDRPVPAIIPFHRAWLAKSFDYKRDGIGIRLVKANNRIAPKQP
jgi:hypothetical protein